MSGFKFSLGSKPNPLNPPVQTGTERQEVKQLSKLEFMQRISKPVESISESLDTLYPQDDGNEQRTVPEESHQAELDDELEETSKKVKAGELRSSTDIQQPGLVILNQPSAVRGPSKYITRMKETTAERSQFHELMQMKFYQKEKDKLREESGGVEPVVFVTKAYKSALGNASVFAKSLEQKEGQKGSMSSLFRNILNSSDRATQMQSNDTVQDELKDDHSAKDESAEFPVIPSEKVLNAIAPTDKPILGTTDQIGRQARLEALKVIAQLENLHHEEESRDDKIAAAKARYLARKKQKLEI